MAGAMTRNQPCTRSRPTVGGFPEVLVEKVTGGAFPHRYARVGGLCRFFRAVERVPARSLKSARCTAVRRILRKT